MCGNKSKQMLIVSYTMDQGVTLILNKNQRYWKDISLTFFQYRYKYVDTMCENIEA